MYSFLLSIIPFFAFGLCLSTALININILPQQNCSHDHASLSSAFKQFTIHKNYTNNSLLWIILNLLAFFFFLMGWFKLGGKFWRVIWLMWLLLMYMIMMALEHKGMCFFNVSWSFCLYLLFLSLLGHALWYIFDGILKVETFMWYIGI